MVNTLKLLLPALFPSWRFFDVIAPSPRIEIAGFDEPAPGLIDTADWREVRPKRREIGLGDRLVSFFWNPRWNETLYLATCAERLMQNPSDHSSREIRRRLRVDMPAHASGSASPRYFRFRLVFVSRAGEGEALRRDVAYVSPPYPTVDPDDR